MRCRTASGCGEGEHRISEPRTKWPVGVLTAKQALPPVRHRPGARSARRERCLSFPSQTKGRETRERYSPAASRAPAVRPVRAVRGLAGPVAAGEQVPLKGTGEGMRVSFTPLPPPFVAAEVVITGN